MGRPELALEEVNRALVARPDDPALHQAAAAAYTRLGFPGAACDAMRRVIAVTPDGDRGFGLLSMYLLQANEPQEAIEAARQATALNPGHPGWIRYLAEGLRLCGEHAEALEHAKRSAALEPEWGEHTLGRVLLLHARWAEAEATLARATAAKPAWAGGPLYLALALVPQGRLDEALDHLQRAVRNDPREESLYLFWARLDAWRRREHLLRKQADGVAKRSVALEELARVLIQQDRLDEAARILEDLPDRAADNNSGCDHHWQAPPWSRADEDGIPMPGVLRMEREVLGETATRIRAREEAAGCELEQQL